MSGDTIPVDIPVRVLTDFFTCPICMCSLRATHSTPCGHRYCEECIKESIGRHHKCPCCNAALQQSSLIRDHQYDELLATLNTEKEKAEKKYFENLIKTATAQSLGTNLMAEEGPSSPIEDVLRRHLKQGLMAHEQFCRDMKTACSQQQAQLENRCLTMIAELSNHSHNEEEIPCLSAELRAQCEQQKEGLSQKLDQCIYLVAEAYDKHLQEHIPKMSILPVKVSVHLLSKNLTLPELSLRPEDGLGVVLDHIMAAMEQRGDKIIKYGTDHALICFGPFAKRSRYEMHQLASNLVELGATHPSVFILPKDCTPVLQFNMKAGSEIAVYGMVQCESDLPKQCFVSTFSPEAAQKVDYFSCKDCGFNWVCRSCMEVCHKDHITVPYIMDHQPTWACCYCPKKKKCTIKVLQQ